MKNKYNYNTTIRRGDCVIKIPEAGSARETALKVNEAMGYSYITSHIVNNLINRREFANNRLYGCVDITRESAVWVDHANHLKSLTLGWLMVLRECKNEYCDAQITSLRQCGYCEECFQRERIVCLHLKKCVVCGRGLVPLKYDWTNRVLHKKCWLERDWI